MLAASSFGLWGAKQRWGSKLGGAPLLSTLFALVQARFGHRALGGLMYAGAAGSTLIPGLFALLPDRGIPLGLFALSLALYLLLRGAEREVVRA